MHSKKSLAGLHKGPTLKHSEAACLILSFDKTSDQAGAQLLVAEWHDGQRLLLVVVDIFLLHGANRGDFSARPESERVTVRRLAG